MWVTGFPFFFFFGNKLLFLPSVYYRGWKPENYSFLYLQGFEHHWHSAGEMHLFTFGGRRQSEVNCVSLSLVLACLCLGFGRREDLQSSPSILVNYSLHHHRMALIISGSFLPFSDLDANNDFLICRTTTAVVNLKVSSTIPPLIFPTVVSASSPLYLISLLEIQTAVSLSLTEWR